MAWQAEVGTGIDRAIDYRDYLTKLVAFMTSQHVATVDINNGGTGGTYAIGDVLTLTHASAFLDARFEVLTVSVGQVLTMRILSNGAFAQRAASATVSVGGSGYVVGDIIEVVGGSSREAAKFKVATLSGSAVATVTLFETGGAYSSTPGNPAATKGIGPAGFAGNDACTLTVTYQALITPLTNIAVTGGGGTGATVDITLAQTGWAVATNNTNDYTHNSLTDEKEVVLVGDAAGFTNKPYIGFRTGTETVSADTRYFVGCACFTAYNPALNFFDQVGTSPGWTSGDAFNDGGAFLVFPQNKANEVDFWFSVDDVRTQGAININPSAATDDGRYEFWYLGFGDRVKTETEDPYPMVCFASSRDRDMNPTVTSDHITSPAECRAAGASGPFWYYRTEDSTWTTVRNNDAGTVQDVSDAMWPFGELFLQNDAADAEFVVTDGPVPMSDNVFKRDRSSPTRILLPTPGVSDKSFRFPLVLIRKLADDAAILTDSVRLQLRGAFAVFNSDAAGAVINDFSEDFLTEGTDRYRVFHNFTLSGSRYQFLCLKEDV